MVRHQLWYSRPSSGRANRLAHRNLWVKVNTSMPDSERSRAQGPMIPWALGSDNSPELMLKLSTWVVFIGLLAVFDEGEQPSNATRGKPAMGS